MNAAKPIRTRHAPRRRLGRGVFLRRRVSFGYAGRLLAEIAGLTLLVLVAVEGIFLSDLLISDLLPQVLEHRAGLLNLLLLLALAVPNGLFLSLPLALLVAAYLTFLRRREAGEFAVVAGMGYSTRLLAAAALVAGLGGFLLSAVLSGYVEPNARYLMRRTAFDVTYGALRDGAVGAGKFYTLGDETVFVSHGWLTDAASNLFIHQHVEGTHNRIVVAPHTRGFTSTTGSPLGIVLQDATLLDFDLDRGGPRVGIEPRSVTTLNRAVVGLPHLVPPDLAGRDANLEEQTTLDLLGGGRRHGEVAVVLGKRLLRALLCLLAPLLAVPAMAQTRPKTLLLALPAAAAVVLGISFFGPRLVEELVVWGLAGAVWTLLAGALALAALVALLVHRWQARCIAPAGVRL